LISAVDGNGTNYVTSATYNPDGSVKSLLNGSTPQLNQSFQYTPRLQMCRIAALTSGSLPTSCTDTQNIGNVMDRGYDFHAGNGTEGSGSDNGNVFAITNYRDTTRSQAFTYDTLNRLTSAWSAANTGTYSWGENYSIDAWGNLQISPMGGKANGGNFQVSGNAQNRPTGLAYDAAGNLMSYVSATYTYDQENRLLSTAGMSYTYDGNDERVLKSNTSSGAPTKRYWSMGGNTLAEGDGSGNLTAEYIYFGSKRVARIDLPANTVHYYLSDLLGSTSLVANAAGAIEEESDYYPFGTEVIVTGGVNELKFTGKRRDTESQLDYFGARYYSNGLGRFAQADPLYVEMHRLIDPQQLNLYTYGRNNPLKYIDPTGWDVTCTGNRCNDYLKALQKDASFKVAYDENGKVVTEGDIDKKSLSKTDKALLKAIDDPKHHVKISAIDGEQDSSVFFGASHGASHTIAFDQAALLDSAKNAGGMTSAQLIGHETLEGYAESQGNSLIDAHNYANEFFGGLDIGTLQGATYGSQNGNVVQLTANFSIHGNSTTERITLQYVTPIPRQDFLKGKGGPYPVYPSDVEAVEKKK
jgi:RHS repeat-associated protein